MNAPPPLPSPHQWRQMAVDALRLAEKAVVEEKDPKRRASSFGTIAGGCLLLDKVRARAVLETAWKESLKIPDVRARGFVQVDLVLDGWAGLDVIRARQQIRLIRDSYWREFASRFLLTHVAALDPKHGVALVNAIRSSETRGNIIFDATREMDREDVDGAVALIRSTKNIDHEKLIAYLISDLVHDGFLDEARRLLTTIHSPRDRAEAMPKVALALAPSQPEDALRMVGGAKGDGIAEVLAKAAAGLVERNRPLAQSSASAAVALAQKADSPVRGPEVLLAILPDIVVVDPGLARRAVEGLPERALKRLPSGYHLLDLAGGWAWVDVARAETYYQRWVALKKPLMTDGHGGVDVPESFKQYIVGLARQNPAKAASTFKAVLPDRSNLMMGRGERTLVEEAVVAALRRRFPDQLVAFGAAVSGEKGRDEMSQRLLADRIRANPLQAERLLSGLSDDYLGGDERDGVAAEIALTVASRDLELAERLVRRIAVPITRVEAACDVASTLYRARDGRAEYAFREALRCARACPQGSVRADRLTQVAVAILRLKGVLPG